MLKYIDTQVQNLKKIHIIKYAIFSSENSYYEILKYSNCYTEYCVLKSYIPFCFSKADRASLTLLN